MTPTPWSVRRTIRAGRAGKAGRSATQPASARRGKTEFSTIRQTMPHRYGYLLSLTDGPVARAFEEYKRRVGVPQHAAVSDKQRYAFENEYIAIAREKAAARKLIRFPVGQGGKEKPRAR